MSDGTIRLIRNNNQSAPTSAVAFSTDDKLIAFGFENGAITIVTTAENRVIFTSKHQKSITAIKFSPDGLRLLSGSYDSKTVLWGIKSGSPVQEWHDNRVSNASLQSDEVLDVLFSDDGKHCISGYRKGWIKVRNCEDGSLLTAIETTYPVDKLALQYGRNTILSASRDIELDIWNFRTSMLVRPLQMNTSREHNIVVDKYGERAISISNNKNITIWNIQSGLLVASWPSGEDTFLDLFLSNDSQLIAATTVSKKISVWNVDTGSKLYSLVGHDAPVTGVTFTPDKEQLISTAGDGAVILWNATNRKIIQKESVGSPILTMLLSADGKWLATGSYNGSVVLWSISENKINAEFDFKHKESIQYLSFLQDTKTLLTATRNKIRLFNLANRTLIKPSIPIVAERLKAAVSPDGKYLAMGLVMPTLHKTPDDAYSLAIYDMKSKKRFMVIGEYRTTISDVKFHPTKNHLLISFAGGIDIYDYKNNQLIATLTSSKDNESTVVTPDGYFDRSAEGSGLITLTDRQATQHYPLSQFEGLLKKPAIVKARLAGDLDAGKPAPSIVKPPDISLTAPIEHLDDYSRIPITVSHVSAIKQIRAFVNGTPALSMTLHELNPQLELKVPYLYPFGRISVYAFDDKSIVSNPLMIDAPVHSHKLNAGILYVLAIGIDTYPYLSRDWQLDYPSIDARSFAAAVEKSMGKHYRKIVSKLILNEDATSTNIIKSIKSLSSLSQQDTVMILLGGHGIQHTDTGKYFLLTADSIHSDQPTQQSAIDWQSLSNSFSSSRAKILLFLDTCHSASITRENIVGNNELAEQLFQKKQNGVIVFSASKGRQQSVEHPDFDGGLFTQTIVQSLTSHSKHADYNQNGFVEYMEMVDYVTLRVLQEDENQTPWLSRKEIFGDFPLAAVIH